jgi:hypothetical protein
MYFSSSWSSKAMETQKYLNVWSETKKTIINFIIKIKNYENK